MGYCLPSEKVAALFQSPVWAWGKGFLLAFLGLRLVFSLFTFPNPDEVYYWLWGQHPGWSYYDHPPFQAWVQGGLAALLGRSNGVLRLPNLLSSIILAVTAYRICRYLYGEDGNDHFWIVLLLMASSPLFFLFLALAWHDHWLVTFAVLSSFAFVRFVDDYRATGRGQTWDLLEAALWLGLAGLCKYTALLVGLGLLATLLCHRPLRRLLGDPRLYLALALLALILTPIGVWNFQHDFWSFRFYSDRTTRPDGLSLNLLQPLVFIVLSGLILGPVQAWSIWQWCRRRPLKAPTGMRPSVYPTVALWLFGLSTGVFTTLSLVSVALYYWNILAYPLLFPLLANQVYQATGHTTKGDPHPQRPLAWRPHRPLAIAQGLGLLAAAGLIIHYTVMPFTAWFGIADPDSAALYGWDRVAAAVMEQAATLENPLLLTTDYRSASALAYKLDNPQVLALSGRLDQFDFWYQAASLQGRDAVLLGESWHPICPAHLALFDRTDPPQTLTVRRWGRPLQTYQILIGHGFQAGPEGYPLRPDYPLAFTSDGEHCHPKS